MANPLRLLLIRHGESEANIVQHHQKNGAKFELEEAINSRVDWKQRLSPKGKIQAEIARRELLAIYGGLDYFDARYVSPFIRARETAAILARNDDRPWQIDDRLSERIWGIYGVVSRQDQRSHFPLTSRLANDDPWYIRYDGGESLFDVYNRFKAFREKLWRLNSNQNVLIVAHKQLIQSACYDIEKMLPEEWDKIYENRAYNFANLGAVEYSRVNPQDESDVRDFYAWRRFINLADRSFGGGDENWVEISSRKAFNSSELLEQIAEYPNFIKN